MYNNEKPIEESTNCKKYTKVIRTKAFIDNSRNKLVSDWTFSCVNVFGKDAEFDCSVNEDGVFEYRYIKNKKCLSKLSIRVSKN